MSGAGSARAAVEGFLDGLAALDASDPGERDRIFLAIADAEALRAVADAVDARPAREVPLRGITVAVKDNIDVAGLPTTAACPSFAYSPERSAVVVSRLVEAGAVVVGKTNLDQFATGLVGTRSPHGPPTNALDPTLVPGGSSSGSGVAVARGLVDLALGTDTAGSGRVPAAFGGIVGLKPTFGRIPCTGVVPAVASADCVSFFVADGRVDLALAALAVAEGVDPDDPFTRPVPVSCGAGSGAVAGSTPTGPLRLGVIDEAALADAGVDDAGRAGYWAAVEALVVAGAEPVDLDPVPLFAAGDLLYGGPFVAERTAAVGDFLATGPDDADPTVAALVEGGRSWSAVDAHRATYALAEFRRGAAELWERMDVFLTPTVPHPVTLTEVAADPLGPNTELGRFTTFANLLDLAALTVPSIGAGPGGPGPVAAPSASVTLYGPAWSEALLACVAASSPEGPGDDTIRLVVAGAHLKGQPLEGQLLDLGATWEGTTRTADCYRMYALPGGPPHKPALIWDPTGASIEVDTWRIPPEGLGWFLTMIPAPLALGTVMLADGSTETGFVAEPRAVEGATDITATGGWRAHVAAPTPGPSCAT